MNKSTRWWPLTALLIVLVGATLLVWKLWAPTKPDSRTLSGTARVSTIPPVGAVPDQRLQKNLAFATGQIQGLHIGKIEAHRLASQRYIALHQIRIDCTDPNAEGIFKALHSVGYAVVTGELRAVAAVDPDQQRLILREMKLSIPGLGQLRVRGVLDNLDFSRFPSWRRKSLSLAMALAPVSLGESELVYVDDSFVARLSAKGGDNAMLKSLRQWLQKTRQTDSHPKVHQAINTIDAYLSQPGQFTMHVHPQKSVPLLAMARRRSAGQWMDLLGLQITAKGPNKISGS